MFLLRFNNLVTPVLIRFVFYAAVALAVILGLYIFNQSSSVGQFSAAAGMLMMLGSVVAPLVLILVARVAAELVLVIFMIRDELAWQREQRAAPVVAE